MIDVLILAALIKCPPIQCCAKERYLDTLCELAFLNQDSRNHGAHSLLQQCRYSLDGHENNRKYQLI